MQAFKLFFKVFRKGALPSSLIYVIIFSALCLLFVQYSPTDTTSTFTLDKKDIAIINNDNSEFSTAFEKYLGENSNIQQIGTSDNDIKDALFYRRVEYVVTIPKGYGDAFMSKNPIELQTTALPDSSASAFIDIMIQQYLKTFNLYLNGTSNLQISDIVSHVRDDLKSTVDINMIQKTKASSMSSMNSYFNYANYPILCILILSIGTILNSLNQTDIKRRNLCAPINGTKYNLQIFLGNLVLTFGVFLLFSAYAYFLYSDSLMTMNGLLYLINLLIISIVGLSLSFLIGNFAGKKALNPICNTVSLGFCFLGGAFVPQDLLSDSVKNFAIINPVFWFIKANNQISGLTGFDFSNISPVLCNMGIELLYAVVFLSVALLIIKQKRTKA